LISAIADNAVTRHRYAGPGEYTRMFSAPPAAAYTPPPAPVQPAPVPKAKGPNKHILIAVFGILFFLLVIAVLIFAPDRECGDPRLDAMFADYAKGADFMIHDAQYTLEEYPSKLSWGHSPAELVVDFARAAGVKRLALFHHDPLRDDAALDQLVQTCRQRAAAGGLEVFAAAEGQTIELVERQAAAPRAAQQPEAAIAKVVGVASATILLVDDDPDIVRLLTMTLRPEGFRLLSASDGNAALEIARAERPEDHLPLVAGVFRHPLRDLVLIYSRHYHCQTAGRNTQQQTGCSRKIHLACI
jgi:hypothetical protein